MFLKATNRRLAAVSVRKDEALKTRLNYQSARDSRFSKGVSLD